MLNKEDIRRKLNYIVQPVRYEHMNQFPVKLVDVGWGKIPVSGEPLYPISFHNLRRLDIDR